MSQLVLHSDDFETAVRRVRDLRPLVHCMTNDVVQEITANVLLAAGASPAMVVAKQEAGVFASLAQALLVNVGTLTDTLVSAMRDAIESANRHGKPWVLDPVGAGGLAYRDGVVAEFLTLKPTVVRGNASEILAISGHGSGGKGVDSTDSSESALSAAVHLAKTFGTVVCVTGQTDYVTDGERIVAVTGGTERATLVVGTGCSLSTLVAAFLAANDDPVTACAAACTMAKRAAEYADKHSVGPGSFKVAYIDGLSLI
ncbi:MAG: hydroxyethylthiazole kinase [Duodenibacillus sp.]|nr:hydroxyethylthiazole kinase [Duodenibacillus sp.]